MKKLTREKLRSLNEQKTRAEILRIDFSSCEQAVETKLKILKDVVKDKDLIITKIQCTMAKHDEDAIQPELGWNIELELDEKEKFQQVCQQLFEITETDIISTENSHILESGQEGATVGTTSNVVFEAQTKQKSSYKGHFKGQGRSSPREESTHTKLRHNKLQNGCRNNYWLYPNEERKA